MIVMPQPQPVIGGLSLPECPRWHDGALYFADIVQGRVHRLDAEGRAPVVYQAADDFVGGIGFLDDAGLVTVSSKRRLLVRADGGAVHARLDALCRFVLNDMIVTDGRAYVTQPGRDVWAGEQGGMPEPTEVLLADRDGTTRIAAEAMMGPNGVAASADGRTLYVAESTAMRITCFAIDPVTGALSGRRVFAQLPDGAIPDGICVDADGGVWAACPVTYANGAVGSGPGVLRLLDGGEVTHVVPMARGRRALACTLGGAGRMTLYICTVPDFAGSLPDPAGDGRIERVAVPVAGCGVP